MDKSKLLDQNGLTEEDVDLEGVGTVRVRALSRYEIMLAGKGLDENDTLGMEQSLLAMAMVDPQMTKADVAKWQKASPLGQIQTVITKVNELSGVGHDAQKSGLQGVREDSES